MNMSLDHKVVPQKSTMMMLADTKSSDDNYLCKFLLPFLL